MRALRTLAVSMALWPAAALAQNPDGVGFRAGVTPDTVYVGQQVTYTLSVRIPTSVRQRLRRNPEFVPPEPRAMLAYDLPLSRVGDASEDVEVHTFRRALFVLSPGRYALGPARLTYALPQSASFFSREDERTLRADGVSFVAIEPPLRGRPPDWLGAVGQWRASLRTDQLAPRVGNPFVLVLRLEGTGNATLLPRPPLRIPWADVVAQDERVRLDSTPALFGGAKEFSWLVTPRVDGSQAVPAVTYPVFDPVQRRYVVARTEPLAMTVRAGTIVAVPPRAAERGDTTPLPIRTALAGARPVRLPFAVALTWLALLAPLPWLLWRVAPQLIPRRVPRPEPPRSARALLERTLATRTGLALAAHTSPGALATALRHEGVTPETAAEVEALRDACDAHGYSRTAGGDLLAKAAATLAKVDVEARRRVLLAVLCLGGLGACVTGGDIQTLQAFTEGRTAYVGADYERAREAFRAAAAQSPRDPAAWANLGAAAWQARDTATAVLGWQRALRLDPRADDVREWLARVPAPQHRGAARVWAIAPLPVLALGLLLWFAGWGWAGAAAHRRRRTRWPLLLVVPGAVGIALGAWQDATLAARDLVVLASPTPLRALPALGADPGAMPITGEVGRVVERRGVWLRINLAGGREGWYPADRVLSLARD